MNIADIARKMPSFVQADPYIFMLFFLLYNQINFHYNTYKTFGNKVI